MPRHGRHGSKTKPRRESAPARGNGGADSEPEGGSSPSMLATGDGGSVISSDEDYEDEVEGAADGSSEVEDENDRAAAEQLKSVSFGTLAKAQGSPPSRKRGRESDPTPRQESEKLDALRARLAEIKQAKAGSGARAGEKKRSKVKTTEYGKSAEDAKAKKRRKTTDSAPPDDEAYSSSSDSDGDAPSTTAPRARSSKHAPTSQSSKYQVSRRREVIDFPRRHARDPRFDVPGRVDASRIASAYSFLRTYEDREMEELRAAIKKGGGGPARHQQQQQDPEARETLRRKLMSMENRKRAREDREREREVVREHRRREREAVGAGKKPFFLKKGEVKREALVKKFEGMKGKERERAVERRRKREAGREMKLIPRERRVAG